jgi:tetratricopeptide (TPR) repeat protein
MTSHDSVSRLSAVMLTALIGLFCLFAFGMVQASPGNMSEADEARMMSLYQAAMAEGRETAAVKIVLDFTEKDSGEYDPATVKLTHRYGYLLYQDGQYRQATEVLKKALERSTVAFGKSGGEAFELNMNIAYANSQWRTGLFHRTKYFNRALEILRERGEHESIAYVTTLINITVNLMDSGSLGGSYTSHMSDTLQSPDLDDYQFPIEGEYSNNFHIAERYVLEAVEVGAKLGDLDEYISSKIAILQAKLKVMETADLSAVPMGVGGYISGGTAREKKSVCTPRSMSFPGTPTPTRSFWKQPTRC